MAVEVVICTLVEVLIAVGCCLGNVLVILAVWTSKSIQQPTFCLVVSLAVADFMVGCVSIPLAVVIDGHMKTSYYGCLFVSCVTILFTLVSALSLATIAVDRFLRVYVPLRYKRTVTQRRCWLVVTVCWLVAIPPSFAPMLGWCNHETWSKSVNSTVVCRFIDVIPMSYLVYFRFFLGYLIPLLVMTVLYGYIFWTIRGKLQEKPGNGAQTRSQIHLKKEKQMARYMLLVLALFALSWLPLHIMNCMLHFGGPDSIPVKAFHVGILFSHANSAVNPFVYAFKIQNIKITYLKLWRRYIARGEELQGCQRPQSIKNNLNRVANDE
ncbi:adenosine receptor A3-like [Etheostoma cragini]|uniref:adenosine receptor A3-like n=1 Tax=Etheostoma cragini TaxID=417921 RepID=UPI00155DED9A|nr:adenosine receptor A3-like [Etheostoma cragini]